MLKIFAFIIVLTLNSCAITRLLNSGTVNIKYRVSEATFDGVTYEEKERLTDPSFSIRNVQHPKSHGRWNFNVRITPSIHYDDTTYGTLAKKPTGEAYPDINLKRFIGFANLKSTFHTPVGAFALSAGFGGTVYKLDDGQGLETIKTREIRRLDLAYYAFFSRKFFLLMGPRYYKAGHETYIFAFRLGYFWGRI
jgi:hypothetical protein